MIGMPLAAGELLRLHLDPADVRSGVAVASTQKAR